MRRAFALAATVGLIAAGIGCKHVGGVCDCIGGHPDNAVLPPATNPYPVTGNAMTGMPAPVMEKAPAPAAGEMKMEKPMVPGK